MCPYQVCGKSFIQRSALTVHVRVHTGERPHACAICLRSFSDSSSLARHRRVHTGTRPYKCGFGDECGKTFCRKTTLIKHIQRQHPKAGMLGIDGAIVVDFTNTDQISSGGEGGPPHGHHSSNGFHPSADMTSESDFDRAMSPHPAYQQGEWSTSRRAAQLSGPSPAHHPYAHPSQQHHTHAHPGAAYHRSLQHQAHSYNMQRAHSYQESPSAPSSYYDYPAPITGQAQAGHGGQPNVHEGTHYHDPYAGPGGGGYYSHSRPTSPMVGGPPGGIVPRMSSMPPAAVPVFAGVDSYHFGDGVGPGGHAGGQYGSGYSIEHHQDVAQAYALPPAPHPAFATQPSNSSPAPRHANVGGPLSGLPGQHQAQQPSQVFRGGPSQQGPKRTHQPRQQPAQRSVSYNEPRYAYEYEMMSSSTPASASPSPPFAHRAPRRIPPTPAPSVHHHQAQHPKSSGSSAYESHLTVDGMADNDEHEQEYSFPASNSAPTLTRRVSFEDLSSSTFGAGSAQSQLTHLATGLVGIRATSASPHQIFSHELHADDLHSDPLIGGAFAEEPHQHRKNQFGGAQGLASPPSEHEMLYADMDDVSVAVY